MHLFVFQVVKIQKMKTFKFYFDFFIKEHKMWRLWRMFVSVDLYAVFGDEDFLFFWAEFQASLEL